jgi:hypothetical protein
MTQRADLAARDVVAHSLGDGRYLVQAVDVAVGIGPAPGDTLDARSAEVGYYVARTAAAELWSLGAGPALAAVTVADRAVADCVLEGVRTAFAEMGEIVPVVRSTENYVAATVSSVSVAVSGVIDERALILGQPRAGHHALLLGGGYHRDAGTSSIRRWPLHALASLLVQRQHLVQVVPVGSSGAERDLEELRRRHGLVLGEAARSVDLRQPGGPGLQFLVIAGGPVECQFLTPLGDLTPDRR